MNIRQKERIFFFTYAITILSLFTYSVCDKKVKRSENYSIIFTALWMHEFLRMHEFSNEYTLVARVWWRGLVAKIFHARVSDRRVAAPAASLTFRPKRSNTLMLRSPVGDTRADCNFLNGATSVYFWMQAFLAGTPSRRTIYRQACADQTKYIMLSHFLGVSPLKATDNIGVLPMPKPIWQHSITYMRIAHDTFRKLGFFLKCACATGSFIFSFKVRMRNRNLHFPVGCAHAQQYFSCPILDRVTLRPPHMGRRENSRKWRKQ